MFSDYTYFVYIERQTKIRTNQMKEKYFNKPTLSFKSQFIIKDQSFIYYLKINRYMYVLHVDSSLFMF